MLACAVGAAPSAFAADSAPAASLRTYYEKLRTQLRWVPAKVGAREVVTPDAGSRLLLARSAAEKAGLSEVGLDFRDVYGVINAETSWFPRDGMGRNGVTSVGLAQFEPATAKALGVRDANDPVEAVHAAAALLKEAAQWSARRIAGLGLERAQKAARLREGVSIYYNLSTAARERWNGLNSHTLPVETQRHIRNVRDGMAQADKLAGGSGVLDLPAFVASASEPVTAARKVVASARPATPQVVGTIEWSGGGSDADARRSGKHVVWSNGTVSRSGGRVRWSSAAPAAERNG